MFSRFLALSLCVALVLVTISSSDAKKHGAEHGRSDNERQHRTGDQHHGRNAEAGNGHHSRDGQRGSGSHTSGRSGSHGSRHGETNHRNH
ncbi:hypothetical protein BV898_06993 [Hypsibius exemplaris]|uniref:Uncharacterized protein n=1 Tax=Hypsibius exemplaris TaxID=2072580 RepID=A0A1W0WUQ4_HYPEX|nr:hypothetical protein BV898_06993 [Hypsibius exemplaris]